MRAEKYNRQINLVCPTCGGDQFEHDDEVGDDVQIFKCAACDREFTKDELIRENSENIAAHQKEMGDEIVKDMAKEFRSSLKKAFQGSKYIKIK